MTDKYGSTLQIGAEVIFVSYGIHRKRINKERNV